MDASWFDQLEGHWQLRRRILDLSAQEEVGGEVGQQGGDRAGHGLAGHGRAGVDAADAAPATITLSGHMVGMATFTRLDAASMAYVESGELVLRDGARLKAVRRYLYRLEDDGACVIDFADGPDKGRRFLRFPDARAGTAGGASSGNGTMKDDHLCGRDLYQVQYRFLGFKAETLSVQAHEPGLDKRILLQRTVVSGPRKDYAIVSRLQR